MTFASLSHYFAELEETASRNEMTEVLAELLARSSPAEIDKVCYFALGRLAPLYAGVEFNLAEKMMIRVLSQAYGKKEIQVGRKYKQLGDLGDVAAFFDKNRRATPLTVEQVYERLNEIAAEAGEGSVERKIGKMAKLLGDLDVQSAKYIVRIPLGKLRLGFSDKTILDALSWMLTGDKSKREEIEEAYNVRADVGQIAKELKIKNEKLKMKIKSSKLRIKKLMSDLRLVKPEIGTPIMPALCQRLPTAEEMIEKVGRAGVEPKYDGTRLQIHFSRKRKWEQAEDQLAFGFRPRGFVRIFTRGLENVTHMFPDLVRALFKEVGAKEAILDGEVIGFDPKTGKFLPFQETIKRKRKYGISRKAKEIPLKFFSFDLLYQDGRDLLKKPFSKRREILEEILSKKNKRIVLSPQIVTDDPVELRRYHQEQVEKGLEGVVVKKWQVPYDPGRRGYTWVKFKQEKGKKGGGLADTLDCVVMGYYRGRGKRTGFGIGAFLVGIRKGDKFLTVSKIGTGLTDEQWREIKGRSKKYEVRSKPKEYVVDNNLTPDVWMGPGVMVVIEADNVTKSPIHTAKYALRFPRLIRFRDDKSPGQATTLGETEKLYWLQK